LTSVTVNSYLDLPVEVQLKLFYSEYDTSKTAQEISDLASWAKARGENGLQDVNDRMNKKYGENLNTFAFGGRLHLRALLDAYFKKVDPKRGTPENIQLSLDYVAAHGAASLQRELVERYKVGLQLSVSEIQGKPLEVIRVEKKRDDKDAGRPAISSLVRGSVQPQDVFDQQPATITYRPLSAALSMSSAKPGSWSVSEDAEIRGLMEVFYAKNNPEKLSTGGVDALMRYARINGLESVNVKLQDKYGEDLDSLKVQYTALVKALQNYYGKVDPSKSNVDDIAAWAIVHGVQPLSERLEKRYGIGLFEDESNEPLDPVILRQRLALFYQTFDKQPKSEQDLDTIVSWALAGSIAQLNRKLKEKYNANLNDLPPIEVGEKVNLPSPQFLVRWYRPLLLKPITNRPWHLRPQQWQKKVHLHRLRHREINHLFGCCALNATRLSIPLLGKSR